MSINLAELLVSLESLGVRAGGGGSLTPLFETGFTVVPQAGVAEYLVQDIQTGAWINFSPTGENVDPERPIFDVGGYSLVAATQSDSTANSFVRVSYPAVAVSALGEYGLHDDGVGLVSQGSASTVGSSARRPALAAAVDLDAFSASEDFAFLHGYSVAAVRDVSGVTGIRSLPAVSSITDNEDGTFDIGFAAPHNYKPWEVLKISGFSQAGANLLNQQTANAKVISPTVLRFFSSSEAPAITDTATAGKSVAVVGMYMCGLMRNGSILVAPRSVQERTGLDTEGQLVAVNGVGADLGAGYGLHYRDASGYRRIGHGAQAVVCTAGNEIIAAAAGSIRGVDKLMVTAAGAITVGTASTKPILPDSYDGHTVKIINVGANNITLTDQGTMAASNLRLTATTVVLGARDSVELTYSSTVGDWLQTGNLVNVL